MRRDSGDRNRTLPHVASCATSDVQPKADNPIKAPVQLITQITQPAIRLRLAQLVMFLLLSFSAGLASIQRCPATPFRWEYTGSLKTARFHHTATLLLNGTVLVAGGKDGTGALTSAELYDPATGTCSETGSLNTARYDQTATLLPNGMVLVAGGNSPHEITSSELYDPATGTWSETGSLNDGRSDDVDALLPNGIVLVADGNPFPLASAELYDPATGTWSLTGSPNTARKDHAATLLPNALVLVTGGARGYGNTPLASAELYDPGIVVSPTPIASPSP